jgi:hypothetical protein
MKYPEFVARPLRLPLACFLSSFFLASAAAIWSIDLTAQAEALKLRTQRERLAQAEVLTQQQATTAEVMAGIAVHDKLTAASRHETAVSYSGRDFRPAANVEIAPATSRENEFWIAQTIRLNLEIPHEGHLLDALSGWRNQSPGLHQVRACRIERLPHALQADCQLVRLTLPEGLSQ